MERAVMHVDSRYTERSAEAHVFVRRPERVDLDRAPICHPERSGLVPAESKDPHPLTLVLLIALVLTFSAIAPVAARAMSRTGSIAIDTAVRTDDGSRVIAGDTFSFAQVATATVDTSYAPAVISFETVDAFASRGRDWASLDASGWRDAARDLAHFAEENDLYEVEMTVSAGGERLALDGLEPGLYLVSRTGVADANKDVACDPVLVGVPVAEDGGLTYDVTVEPKYEWGRAPGGSGGGQDVEKPRNEHVYHVLGMPMTGDGAIALMLSIAMAGLGALALARRMRDRKDTSAT